MCVARALPDRSRIACYQHARRRYSTPDTTGAWTAEEVRKLKEYVYCCGVLLWCAVMCCAVLCCAVLCCAVPCCAVM